MSEDTDLANKTVRPRVAESKATPDKLKAKLVVSIKTGVHLSEFKPRTKTVKVMHQGNKKATPHTGVTVKIGNQPRQLVPGGWLAQGKSSGKDLVLSRKGQARTPTQALKTKVLTDVVKANQAVVEKHMKDVFEKDVASSIDYAIQSQLNKNK